MERTIREWIIYFTLYSVIGWLYEVFLEVVVYRWGYSDRGVLMGPYCIIYGVGALLLVTLLSPLMKKDLRLGKVPVTPLAVFLAIVVIATAVELAGSYVMEWLTGGWMWDYTRYAVQFQGRVALNPSIRFGLGGMVFLYLLQPLFRRITDHMSPRAFQMVSTALGVLLAADLVITLLR